MDTLPVVVHSATLPRVDAAQVARFETILDAADAAVAAALQWRSRGSDLDRASTDSAEQSLRVVLAAICATCDGVAPPDIGASQRELLKWTVDSITNARDTAVGHVANNGIVRGIPPAHVEVTMELMGRLNQAMGGGGGPA